MSETHFSKPLIYMLIGSAIILGIITGCPTWLSTLPGTMSDELARGHNVFSLAIAMQNLIWGAAQPFTGALADKYGSKIVVTVGGVLYTIGLLLMAVSSTGWLLNLSVGLILGLALSATSSVLLSAVGRAAPPEKRSLAMGIASAAGSFGQFVMLPSTLLLLQNFGWSAALVVSAILIAMIVPLAWMLKAPAFVVPNTSTNQVQLSFKDIFSHCEKP